MRGCFRRERRRPEINGLQRTATRLVPRRASISNWSRFPPRLASLYLTLVKLPPGCARLSTKPSPTGSETNTNTTGVVTPAPLSARTAGEGDRDDDVGSFRREFGDEESQLVSVSFRAQQLDDRAASIFVAELPKLGKQQMDRRAVREATVQDTDPRPLSRPRRRRERCGEDPGDDRTPPHSVAAPTRPWP